MTVTSKNPEMLEHPIVFYDGVCVLCNSFVDKVINADTSGIFRFAPLQGDTARTMLPPLPEDPSEWSVVYLDADGIRTASDASLEIVRRLGGWWTPLAWCRIVPRGLRDFVYRFVARHRYRTFGKRDACTLLTPDQQARILP